MPRSRNKYSRARMRERSRRTRHQRSSGWFYATVAAIVVVGSVAIGATVASRDTAAAPSTTDHWHAALGANICGQWLSDPATFATPAGNSGVAAGIHTHGDGFIHIHPHSSAETGDNATLGKFMSYGGWSVSEDSISVWQGPEGAPQKTTWENGDRCPNGERGEVVFEVNCKTVDGNPSDHKLADQEVVAIGFVPEGEEMGAPPNAASAPEVDAGDTTQPTAISQEGCRPSATNNPGVAETVAPTTAPNATSPTP